MTLPKARYLNTSIRQPSTGKDLSFRPFCVAEEKILLMAKESALESRDATETLRCIRNLLLKTCQDPKALEGMTVLDMTYLFLKLRSVSVSNVIDVTYTDNEDGKPYSFRVNLDNLDVTKEKQADNRVKISEGQGIVLRNPPAIIYEDRSFGKSKQTLFDVVPYCIDQAWDGDKTVDVKKYPIKEIQEFVDGFPVTAFDEITKFLETQPRLHYELNYKNSKGNDRSIVLSTITDFFSLV